MNTYPKKKPTRYHPEWKEPYKTVGEEMMKSKTLNQQEVKYYGLRKN
jgi:hypothetical protein